MNDKDLTIEEQKSAGVPLSGALDTEYKNFLQTLKKLLDDGTIDPFDPQTFLNAGVYNDLDEEVQEKADLALVNIAHQIRLIHGFLESSETPDESPQLQTMVEQLWEMKQKIEIDNDVFVF